jgi:GAF domain-containing protein
MLEQMGHRLRANRTFEDAVGTVLDDVIALHGAEFGNIQMPVGNSLIIVDQRGLSLSFLQTFREVCIDDGCACGRALRNREAVVVIDVDKDEEYAPFREAAKEAGYRAFQSSPLVTKDGNLLAVVSTYFANVHAPTAIEMATLKGYGEMAADYLYQLLGSEELVAKAKQMHLKLYALADS